MGYTGLGETEEPCVAAAVYTALVCPVLKGLRMQVSPEIRDGQKCQPSAELKQTNCTKADMGSS